jgi:rhamnose utilization protein RhaD (predicted bifunctional aldolase and dehydrogenase)
VKSRYTDTDAAEFIARYAHTPGCNEDIALRVYTSRLLGSDGALVLHGGGNTSVKTLLRDDTGALVDVLCVKGSGWDLDTLEPRGLPAVRMDSLVRLRERDALSDEDMVNAQRTRLLDASAPNPSVETLLHAFLPATFIDHSHADAVLALANQPNSAELCREVFGDTLAIVPYVMPGFALAKLAAEVAAAHPSAHGLVLLNHGLFTYGATAQESYERHIAAVDKAERYIATRVAALGDNVARKVPKPLDYAWLAPILRGELSGPGRRRASCWRAAPRPPSRACCRAGTSKTWPRGVCPRPTTSSAPRTRRWCCASRPTWTRPRCARRCVRRSTSTASATASTWRVSPMPSSAR